MLKTIIKIKIEIIEIKKKLEAKQQHTWNNKQFQKHILEIINTKLKELSYQKKFKLLKMNDITKLSYK